MDGFTLPATALHSATQAHSRIGNGTHLSYHAKHGWNTTSHLPHPHGLFLTFTELHSIFIPIAAGLHLQMTNVNTFFLTLTRVSVPISNTN
jgi:hypothetical protein